MAAWQSYKNRGQTGYGLSPVFGFGVVLIKEKTSILRKKLIKYSGVRLGRGDESRLIDFYTKGGSIWLEVRLAVKPEQKQA